MSFFWVNPRPSAVEFDEFFGRMNRLFREIDAADHAPSKRASWPSANLYDNGSAFVLRAALPGLSVEDLKLTVNAEGLTIAGDRRLKPPEGYSVHRQERANTRFSRSFTFPSKVDPDKVEAVLKDGLLQVTLPKLPELQPRTIEIRPQ